MSVSDPQSTTVSGTADYNLQPFFVLHKALPQKPERKDPRAGKSRKKIDLSTSPTKSSERSDDVPSKDEADQWLEELRIDAFNKTWLEIESTIKDVLRRINVRLFDEVSQWISESFEASTATADEHQLGSNQPYPVINDNMCNQIPTALIVTKNMEVVDDLLTFQELSAHLKTKGCHTANISSIDFVPKHGIGGCIRSLLRQLIGISCDSADISVLASWYCENENHYKPVVVVIDDTEQCCGFVLAEFIVMLSEWFFKIPIILIFGVATMGNSLRKLLSSDAMQRLQLFQFTSESPHERMNFIIESVLVKPSSAFILGHRVALFLRNYFLRHDGTTTSFIRALKIACAKHFLMEPLSFLGYGLFGDDYKILLKKKCLTLPSKLLCCASSLSSWEWAKVDERDGNSLLQAMLELRKSWSRWSSVLLCLFEVGKMNKMQLFDLFCEAVDPALYKLSAIKGRFINQIIQKVRDLSLASLVYVLEKWRKHTEEFDEVHTKVLDLLLLIGSADDDQTLKQQQSSPHKSISRCSSIMEKDALKLNVKVAALMDDMVRRYLKPIECVPIHEIVCFKHVELLQEALIGDPRRTIQLDLLKSQTYIQCCCCLKDGNFIPLTMHDTSIIYTLAQEHGDLINLHDWFQSFKAVVCSSDTKLKHKIHRSPAAKKVNVPAVNMDTTETMIQARFCRAVTELQISGLLRMPSKRRPDCVQRVAFGI